MLGFGWWLSPLGELRPEATVLSSTCGFFHFACTYESGYYRAVEKFGDKWSKRDQISYFTSKVYSLYCGFWVRNGAEYQNGQLGRVGIWRWRWGNEALRCSEGTIRRR